MLPRRSNRPAPSSDTMKVTSSTALAILRPALPGVAAAAVAVTLSATALAEVTIEPASKGYDIDVTDNASSTELLDAITEATGATIKGRPDEVTLSANHLKGTSLERAIRMLIPGTNFVVRLGPDGAPAQIIFLSASPGDGGNGDADQSGNDDSASPDVQDPSTDGGDTAGTGTDDDQSSQ